jgi:hypothetical protein
MLPQEVNHGRLQLRQPPRAIPILVDGHRHIRPAGEAGGQKEAQTPVERRQILLAEPLRRPNLPIPHHGLGVYQGDERLERVGVEVGGMGGREGDNHPLRLPLAKRHLHQMPHPHLAPHVAGHEVVECAL